MVTLPPYYLRLDCTVASTIPRLAFSGVANALPGEISTRITMHPCFVAHYVINFGCPWIYLRCIWCGLPDLYLLYNGVLSWYFVYRHLRLLGSPALLGDLYLFH